MGGRPRLLGRSRCWTSCLRTALAPELTTRALELRASIAVRSGSVREAAALLERAAAATDRPDVRAVLLAEALHATLFLADGAAAGRLVDELDLGGGGDDVDAIASHRHRGGRDGQGHGGPRRHRGAPRRRTPPGGHPGPAGRRPRGVVADVRPAVHPRRRDRPRAARAGRRGTGAGRGGHAARTALPGGARRGDVRLVGPGRGGLHRGDPAGAGHRPDHRAGDVAGGSVVAGVAVRSGGGVPGARRGGAGPVRRPRHPLGRGLGVVLARRPRAVPGRPGARRSSTCRSSTACSWRGQWPTPTSHRDAELVDVLLRLGRVDEATRTAAAYVEAADAKGQPWARARARRCLRTGRWRRLRRPVRARRWPCTRRRSTGFEAARTALAYGDRLRRAGRRVDARVQLRRALDDFTASRRRGVGRPGGDRARPHRGAGAGPPAGRHRGAHPAGAAGGPPARRRADDAGRRRRRCS